MYNQYELTMFFTTTTSGADSIVLTSITWFYQMLTDTLIVNAVLAQDCPCKLTFEGVHTTECCLTVRLSEVFARPGGLVSLPRCRHIIGKGGLILNWRVVDFS